MFFAEAEGFSRFHVHLVPRMPTSTRSRPGPEVFVFLRAPEPEHVPEQERDLVALRLRAALEAR